MRLFLASEILGNYADELLRLTKGGRKMLVVSNARDHRDPEARQAKVRDNLALFEAAGFEPTELDLRNYFGKPSELAEFVENFAPDVVFSMGGNVFLLRTAMKLSGLDNIIIDGVKNDKFVYAGYSAGSMVAVKTLKYYGHDDLVADKVPEIYGVESEMSGLGLIDEYIVAHADVEKHAETTKMYLGKLADAGEEAIVLNQSSVYVIDGDEKKLYK
ncbi:MAG: Type 1 glutamine amidotransferase-like domain-containing protein [Candidatus Saccharibacteria bacterium]|nr:Type 1 glutamine amidotransferase-like domain-containing protein [Candidatus Saccharibacteria bacterium]